jgi:hypothetical protein
MTNARLHRFFFSAALFASAASPSLGATGAAFLNNSLDVRSEALGGGGQVLSEGAGAAFGNPAGAAHSNANEMMFSYSQGLLDTSYQGMSYTHALASEEVTEYRVSPNGMKDTTVERARKLTIGAHLVYNSLGTFQSTDENYTPTDTLRPYNVEGGMTLAKGFGSSLSAGITLKVVHQSLGQETANSYAGDIGVIGRTGIRGLTFSSSITNLGTTAKFVSQSFSLPTAANLGLGYQFHFVRILADFRQPLDNDNQRRFSIGTELTPIGGLSLRIGYLNQLGGLAPGRADSSRVGAQGLGFGAGLIMGRYGLDYAVVPNAFDVSNKISLRMAF